MTSVETIGHFHKNEKLKTFIAELSYTGYLYILYYFLLYS